MDGTITYGHDDTNQLTSAAYSWNPNLDETHTYDANGNRDDTNFTPWRGL